MGDVVSTGANNDDLIDELKKCGYIQSPRVEKVFRLVDRGHYLLTHHRHQAYIDNAWKSGKLHISAPVIYAKVLEGLQIEPGMAFLNIGAGTGYLSTMAGLLIGSFGVSHGIELHDDVIKYAEERMEKFKQDCSSIDVCNFCEPQFVHGNALCLPEDTLLYDRVYCGAYVPREYEEYMKKLIKIGGILIMPSHLSQLMKITRVEQNEWKSEPLLTVSFAPLVLPDDAEIPTKKIIPPKMTIMPLMDICRQCIRTILRSSIERESPELEQSFISKIERKTTKDLNENSDSSSPQQRRRLGFLMLHNRNRDDSDSDSDLIELDTTESSNSPQSDVSMLDVNLTSLLSRGICGRFQIPATVRDDNTENSEQNLDFETNYGDDEDDLYDEDESMMTDSELVEIDRIERAAGNRLKMKLRELGEEIRRTTRSPKDSEAGNSETGNASNEPECLLDSSSLSMQCEGNESMDDNPELLGSKISSDKLSAEVDKSLDVYKVNSGTLANTTQVSKSSIDLPGTLKSSDVNEETIEGLLARDDESFSERLNENLSNLNRLTENFCSKIDEVVNSDSLLAKFQNITHASDSPKSGSDISSSEERLCGKKSPPESQTSGEKSAKFLKSSIPRFSDDITDTDSSRSPSPVQNNMTNFELDHKLTVSELDNPVLSSSLDTVVKKREKFDSGVGEEDDLVSGSPSSPPSSSDPNGSSSMRDFYKRHTAKEAWMRETKKARNRHSKEKKEDKIEISIEPLKKYSKLMNERIHDLPLPNILKLYMNYNREFSNL